MSAALPTLESQVVASPHQVSTTLGGEAVILNSDRGVYHGLDPVGARIWELLRQPRSVRELRDAILGEYEIGAARCEADLLALLRDLAANGLIEVRN